MRECFYSIRFTETEEATLARIATRMNQKRSDVLRWLVNAAGDAIVANEPTHTPRALEVGNATKHK